MLRVKHRVYGPLDLCILRTNCPLSLEGVRQVLSEDRQILRADHLTSYLFPSKEGAPKSHTPSHPLTNCYC